MYAFAVLLNELLSEQVPFPDCSYVQIVQSVGTFRQRPVAFRAEAADEVGRALVGLIARCWHQDPALRMSFDELGGELTHLLRKTVECARVGDQAAPLTPPRSSATDDVESAITKLSSWLTSACNVDDSEAMPLAHTLVTVKRITTVTLLTQVLQRSPDFLTKEMQQSVVLETQVCAALSIGGAVTPPPAPTLSSCSSVKLESLSCDQLCALLDHCYVAEFKSFVMENEFKGTRTIIAF